MNCIDWLFLKISSRSTEKLSTKHVAKQHKVMVCSNYGSLPLSREKWLESHINWNTLYIFSCLPIQ